MDKTIKINLGGILFHIDEEAYTKLRKYLQDIDIILRKTPGGAETLEDIESRIAEIFQTQGTTAGIISKENVEAMIGIIGKPEDFDTSAESSETHESFYRSSTQPKKLYRNPDDQIISGVCGGIGAFLNIEGVWIRLLFIIFACVFGIGFLVYIALWIGLPVAHSDSQKREMYGRDDYMAAIKKQKTGYTASTDTTGSSVGNAFNEVFRAIGKVLFIILRIIFIILGISFVIAGFITLVSFIMIFFFKYPGYFSTHSFGINLFYLPDFLNYIVNPAVAPWILILTFIVVLMPLLALIYWGVKMIFWFRAKDGIFSLIGLIIWVVCLAVLSLLLFNEGISYGETGKTVSEEVIQRAPDDIYIMADHKIADLNYDKEISFDEEDYNVFLREEDKGLYISTELSIYESDDNSIRITLRKRSTGRSRVDATRKAENLLYNYRIAGDTIYFDEYFSIPSGTKWSFDDVNVNLYIPEGTRVHFDTTTEDMFRKRHDYDNDRYWDNDSDERMLNRSSEKPSSWRMTDDGLKRDMN